MPLWIILIPLALFIPIYAIFAFVDLGNLWRFRTSFFSASFLTVVFFGGTAAILFLSYLLLFPVDWTQSITIDLNISQFSL